MPLITRRSSTRRAPGWFFGNCGSIAAQASSLNQNKCPIIIAGGAAQAWFDRLPPFLPPL